MEDITYSILRHESNRVILKTYYRDYYIGESVGYWKGADLLSVYPKTISRHLPTGVLLKRTVSLRELRR